MHEEQVGPTTGRILFLKGGEKVAKSKRKQRKVARDAGSGQFITLAAAKRRPKTTVVETVPIRRGRRK